MSGKRHEPIRTCLGCGGRSAQTVMFRIVRDASGRLLPDWHRRLPGRGGYLHESAECWAEFRRRKGFVRSLKAVVSRSERATLFQGEFRSFVAEG